jgi:ABC-type nitrate/sulfonate/bicarbonate transport system substrate-binding protein
MTPIWEEKMTVGEIKTNRRQVLLGGIIGAATLASHGAWAQSGGSAKVKVVMTQGVSGLALHQLAKDQGFFEEFKVDPEVILVSDGAKCVSALLSGASEICMWSGFNQVVPAIAKGAKIKILAGALSLPSLAIYSSRPEVKTLADIEGKVIGIGAPGSVLHQMIVYLMTKRGLNPDTVTFRNVGSNADIFRAVVAGTVDVGPSDVDVFDQQQHFGVHAIEHGLLWSEIPEYTNQASYASDAAIRDNRANLAKLLAAYGKAYRYVCGPNSREAFIKARQRITGESNSPHAISQWTWIQKYQPYAVNLTLSDEQINLVQKLNVQFKSQPDVLPIASVADMSVAKEALKLLS